MVDNAVGEIVAALRKHPSVKQPVPKPTKDGENWIVSFEISIQLPRDAIDLGVTKTGVRSVEPVSLKIPPTFPFKAPYIQFRSDFNRAHPHINPTAADKPVNPCISEEPLDELLQDPGWIDEIINRIVDWLDSAAIGDLMDCSHQGWEPIRRDEVKGRLIFDPIPIYSHAADMAGPGAHYVGYKYFADTRNGCSGQLTHLDTPALKFSDTSKLSPFEIDNYFGFKMFSSLGLVLWSGRKTIFDNYLPDDVFNISSLQGRAKEYDCLDVLEARLKELSKYVRINVPKIEIAIIFVVKRPCNVIGQSSEYELIPYSLSIPCDESGSLVIENSDVSSLGLVNDMSPSLLGRLAGREVQKNVRYKPILFIGCGSVGSKISMHLARSGFNSFRLIDKDMYYPHNNARHGIVWREGVVVPKTEILSFYLEQFNSKVSYITEDIIECLVHDAPSTIRNPSIIIDTTASSAVREALAKFVSKDLKTGIVRGELYDEGSMSTLFVEGSNRNPRIDDLTVQIYQYGHDDPTIRQHIYRKNNHGRVPIGQSCGSFTMAMSDALVSMYSAGMSQTIQNILDSGFPAEGIVQVGLSNEHKTGITWMKLTPWRMQIISTKSDDTSWEVRLPEHLIEKISVQAQSSLPNETGGVLIGHIFWGRKVITVSEVLDPPPDSIMTPGKFILGTQNLRNDLHQIETKTNGTLTYLGTWHSHPAGGAASQVDKDTLAQLVKIRGLVPTICLICGPKGISIVNGPVSSS